MTRKTNFPTSRPHVDVAGYSLIDVISAIELAANEAIDSIQAASAAARRANQQPQLAVNDAIDAAVNDAVDAQGFTGLPFSTSNDVAGAGVATFAHDAHQVGVLPMTVTGHVGQFSSATADSVSLDADKDSSPASWSPAETPTHVSQTLSGSADASGNGTLEIPSGGTLELTSPYSGTIAFEGATGTLKIANSASFTGKIDGQLAVGDVIDFADVTAGAGAKISYSGDNSPGTLTVSDGTHTASVALLGNYSLANFTAASDGHGGTSVVDPPVLNDGSAGAPGGAPQLPNLLSGYTVRPSWKVAGVDYAVGITSGTVLKDPATINMAGVTVDKSLHQVIVTASNVTLDGYDFSLAGGWELVTQAANTTVSNSNFKIGANHNPLITAGNGSSNLTVLNCVLDGNNTYDTLDNDLIGAFTPGLTVKYSVLENGYAHLISAAGGTAYAGVQSPLQYREPSCASRLATDAAG
ncbi:hypothetical protein AC629_04245 [Bradyrhizobium sp. NAS80.1]|uniref:hypothetical protein n=1 Tax=Bradyrhizobium sp. NAS80.1 TaxID=1680159 RepID=UPI0009621C25|nr:hypothetical protein [Bradyrhizobium sp. NAS80.1]OKO90678.1 hypothetical protein AC629_04245 [Bradyrhizobium sp. NAS80.1]